MDVKVRNSLVVGWRKVSELACRHSRGKGSPPRSAVADDRVANVVAVNAELIRASGYGFELNEYAFRPAFYYLVTRRRRPSVILYSPKLLLFVTTDRPGDLAFVRVDPACRDRGVSLLDGLLFKLRRDDAVGTRVLGDDHDAGRVFVEAMDESGPHDLAAFDLVEMMRQGIEQSVAAVAVRRVDEHARGLFDDGEV